MKYLLIPLLLSFSELKTSYQYQIKKKLVKKSSPRRRVRKSSSKIKDALRKLEQSEAKLLEYIDSQNQSTLIKKEARLIKALSIYEGVLRLPVSVSNTEQSLIIVDLVPNEFFSEARLKCEAIYRLKRAHARCNLLSDGEAIQVDATLLETDGSVGLIPDSVHTSELEVAASETGAGILEGVISTTKEGVLSSLANNLVKRSSSNNPAEIQIALFNPNRSVAVLFSKQVSL